MDINQAEAQLFKVLMHPTRLAILNELRNGEQCVCHIEAMLGLRQAYISQHLMMMRDAGLVSVRRDRWNIFYSVTKPEIYQVIEAMKIVAPMINRDKGIAVQTEAKSPSKQRPCPCPKCNPDTESSHLETHEMVPDEFQASV
jgi:DNA-binding transcriptional ArsR family regulator